MRHKVTTDLLYPQLWRGCVGAWAPCLGPSGTTLRDWSGSGRHGTLTNMDAATDWVVSDGKYALDFDGTNDRVECSTLPCFDTGPLSVSMWIKIRTTSTRFLFTTTGAGSVQLLVENGAASRLQFQRKWTTTNISRIFSSAMTLNTWQHTVVTWNGGATGSTSIEMAMNGVYLSQVSATNGGTYLAPSAGASIYIASSDGGSPEDCVMDDVRVYDRVITAQEIRTLARRRGIAYETKRRSRGYVAAAGITGPLIGGRLVGGAALIGGRLVR